MGDDDDLDGGLGSDEFSVEDSCLREIFDFGSVDRRGVGVDRANCNELKKLTDRAGFSRTINRNRKSSFRFRGRPGRRKRTSLVLTRDRNSDEAVGIFVNR